MHGDAEEDALDALDESAERIRRKWQDRRRERSAIEATPEWTTAKTHALDRDGWSCRWCISGFATEVHPMNSVRLPEAVRNCIVAVCDECRAKLIEYDRADFAELCGGRS